MRCNKCGEKLNKNDSYCPFCGEKYTSPKKIMPKSNKVYIKIEDSPAGWKCYIFEAVLLLICCLAISILPATFSLIGGNSFKFWIVAMVFPIPGFFVAKLLISDLDTLEIINGEQIKITRAWKRKYEYYSLSDIAYLTDGANYIPNKFKFKYPLLAMSKDGDILFQTLNFDDIRILFAYYGVEIKIYHGV